MANQYVKQIDNILRQEVDRSQFLKYTGVALLGVMGISSFIKNLHKSVQSGSTTKRTAGYGKSAYGR